MEAIIIGINQNLMWLGPQGEGNAGGLRIEDRRLRELKIAGSED